MFEHPNLHNYSVRGRSISPTHSIGGTSQTEYISEEMRFKMEMRRMELEEDRDSEPKRLEAER